MSLPNIAHLELNEKLIQEFTHKYDIPSGARTLLVAVSASCEEKYHDRGSLISYQLTDENGNRAFPEGVYSKSRILGSFFYLNIEQEDANSSQFTVIRIDVPYGAQNITFTGNQWKKEMVTRIHSLDLIALSDDGLTQEIAETLPTSIVTLVDPSLKKPWARRFEDRAPVEPGNSIVRKQWSIDKEIVGIPRGLSEIKKYHAVSGPKSAKQIKVAVICDEFSFNSFAPEFTPLILDPERWEEQIEEFQPDLFLCESAWSGVDSKVRPWRGKIYGSIKFAYENRKTLFDILTYSKKNGIPTVFWNKEDPTHFPDRVNDFVSTAARFDFVLTTAEEVVDGYRKFLPVDRVGVMQFAAQPEIFNPLSSTERLDKTIFAGAWYQVHEERSRMMHEGIQYALDSGLSLDIYDRNYGNTGDMQFPDAYQKFLKPSVTHERTAALYKQYSLGLNFNTVTDSKTMFARRVFELAASGTTVLSNFSPGINEIYGEDVIYFDRDKQSLKDYSSSDRATKALRALETTMSAHTYRHRFEQLLSFVGVPYTSSRQKPTMAVSVSSHDEAMKAIAIFNAASHIYSKLLIVVSGSVRTSEAGTYMTRYMSKLITVVSQSLITKEHVPTSNYVSTADIIWVDINVPPSRAVVEKTLLHGEYTHLPVISSNTREVRWSASQVKSGMRLSAADVGQAIQSPNSVVPVLEVPL